MGSICISSAGRLADEVQALTATAAALGASAERRRIAQDLHDDVIPPLLSFIYRAQEPRLADGGRVVLQGLREVLRQLDSGDLA